MGTTVVKCYEREWDFVTVWKTDNLSAGSTGSNQINLPLWIHGTYNFTVDWGDGTYDNITSWNQPKTTHTYATPGVYQLRIKGLCRGWRFGNEGDRLKLLEVKQWGKSGFSLGSSSYYFYGCANCIWTTQDILDLTGVTSLFYGFRGCSSMQSIPRMNEWDTSKITSLFACFTSCYNFNQNINDWDISNVTSLHATFSDCRAFNQPLDKWNTSKVTDMGWLFRGDAALPFNQSLNSWDVSNVVSMEQMLRSCVNYNHSFDNWNIEKVTNMSLFCQTGQLSTSNYSDTLIAWSTQNLRTNVSVSFNNAKYTAGAAATARQYIIDTFNWTIADGGQA